MKQIQDAYIVAAARTPIGRSHRGFFRNTRPDDLLVAAIQAAMKQVPSLDPKAIEDAIVGCARPEGEHNLVQGEVKEMAYFGSFTVYHLKLASGAVLKVSRANTERHADEEYTWGDRIWAHWSPSSQVVLTQ